MGSRYVPRQGESISISVEIGAAHQAISLYGSVLRVTRYIADHKGEACRFSVRFGGVTPESMMLVRHLMSRKA